MEYELSVLNKQGCTCLRINYLMKIQEPRQVPFAFGDNDDSYYQCVFNVYHYARELFWIKITLKFSNVFVICKTR